MRLPWPYSALELLKAALIARYAAENPWRLPDLPELNVADWFGADLLAELEADTEVWEPGEFL